MTKITPTPEQQAVIDGVASRGAASIMCNAYAGCSKTTTIELSAPGVRTPALAIAFNKANAVEMAKRLPGNFTCKTMNGLGHAAWGRAIQANSITVDDRKVGKLVSQVAKDRRVALLSDQWDDLRRLVSKAMSEGLVPDGSGPEGLVPDSPEGWGTLGDGLWITQDNTEFLRDLAREVLSKSIILARAGTISFDDQIYCPVMLGGRWPIFPFIAVDEAQDLSPMNHRQVGACLRPDGRLFVVGDSKQAIYGWRGADGNSMGSILSMRSEWVSLPLQTTFRCPQEIVARNRGHAPGFTAWHTNRPGSFVRWQRPRDESPDGPIWEGWGPGNLLRGLDGRSIAILCRNNAPIMGLALKLLKAGVGVKITGRDIGKSLISLSRKIIRQDEIGDIESIRLITEWSDHEQGLARTNDHEERCESIQDRAEALIAILQGGARTAGELRDVLTRLFDSDGGLVTLSTIHRAKGMEWDRVMLLDPWRLPSKWAKQAAARGNEIPLRQEYNLIYVAETRTRDELIYANAEDFAA
jgi:DNA helicase-2/ATP-dependent DNA helicase PcrA